MPSNPAYGHACEISTSDIDLIDLSYPRKHWWHTIRKWYFSIIIVSQRFCKYSQVHLRSHTAILNEQKRHLQEYPYTIHPYSALRIFWEIIQVVLTLLQLALVALDLGYSQYYGSLISGTIRWLIDTVCFFDVIINLFTGYYDETTKEITLAISKIITNYARKTLLFDIIISVPVRYDYFFNVNQLVVFKILDILKFFNYYKFHSYLKKLEMVFNWSFYVVEGFILGISVVLYWHIFSAVQNFFEVNVFTHGGNDTSDGRITLSDDRNSYFYNISKSLYHGALIINLSYGYNSTTMVEFGIRPIFWYCSKFGNILILWRTMEFMKAYRSSQVKYSQMVNQLDEFVKHKQFPPHVRDRIIGYYEYHFQRRFFKEQTIWALLSNQLKQEIIMESCRQLVENVDFFRQLPLNILTHIITCLSLEIFLTNDVVVRANTQGSEMYFISTGTVAVYTSSGKEVCHLEDGAYFGEISLLVENKIRVATVVAVEICELYKLDRKDFMKAIHPYPDLKEKIKRIAADRLEKTAMMEEYYKNRPSTVY